MQLIARDCSSGALEQAFQHLVGLLLKSDRANTAAQLMAEAVQLEFTERSTSAKSAGAGGHCNSWLGGVAICQIPQ